LWENDRCSFAGRYYQFEEVAFVPKPFRKKLAIWVGGEGRRAQRRAGEFGDAWFPYFVGVTPHELLSRFENVRRWAVRAKRDPDSISLNCCLPIELTDEAGGQEEGSLRGNSRQVSRALKAFEQAGVQHLALQFMIPRWPDRARQIELFSREILVDFKSF
jgi:alkanesulfonate monooxygenase SsuD/methylene tetrahydromethanopterin reductase-like flavin-dependent oxidoreductase (luciferase family)